MTSRIHWNKDGDRATIYRDRTIWTVEINWPEAVTIKRFDSPSAYNLQHADWAYLWRGRLSSKEHGQNIARRVLRKLGAIAPPKQRETL